MHLVKDWGGFEELVARLNETGKVSVQRDVTLVGKSGAPRQIDVLITHTEGLYSHRILVECKYWKEAVKRAQIDAMVAAIEDLNASRGVFFTTKGYQSGAETITRSKGIDIFLVRELTDAEWGLPGRRISLYLQVLARAIGNLQFPGVQAAILDSRLAASPPPGNLAISAGPNGFESYTPVVAPGKPWRTLEELLDQASMDALKRMTAKTVTFNRGAECTVHLMAHLQLPFSPSLQIPQGPGMVVLCPKIECDVGVRVHQSPIDADRGANLLFALAVENCITGVVYSATRGKGDTLSSLRELSQSNTPPGKDVLENGSVLRVTTKAFFDFTELAGVVNVPWPKELEP